MAGSQKLAWHDDLNVDDDISISSDDGDVDQASKTTPASSNLDDTIVYNPLQGFRYKEQNFVENPDYSPLPRRGKSTRDVNIQTDKSDFINHSNNIYTDIIDTVNMSMSETEMIAQREQEEAMREARRQELAEQLHADQMNREHEVLNADYRHQRHEREIDNRNLNISLTNQHDINQSILKTHESLLNMREIEIQENQARSKSIKWANLLANVVKADGFLPEETERFIDDIDLTLQTYGHPDKSELACYLATKDSQGDLKRFIINYIQESNKIRLQVPWADLKDEILRSFVSRDLKEDHRRKLELLRQSPGETLQAYIRRFCFLANKAYSESSRPVEIDRLIMKCYIKSVYDKQIIERMYSQSDPPTTLREAIVMSEKIQGCMQQLQSVGLGSSPKVEIAGLTNDFDDNIRDSKEEIKRLKKENAQLKTQKAKDDAQLLVRIEQLERLQHSNPTTQHRNENRRDDRGYDRDYGQQRDQYQRGPPRNYQFGSNQRTWRGGKPVCDYCGREGHIHIRCWEKHPEQRQRFNKSFDETRKKEIAKEMIQRDQTDQEN
jgi:hypothetical protein